MSQALDDLRKLCRKYLEEAQLRFMVDQDDDFVLQFTDGVMVYVMPRDWAEGNTIVQVMAVTNKDVRVEESLGNFLAVENSKILFGRLGLYPDRKEVHFEHTLLGDWLNRAELETAIRLVASSSNVYDDQIKERWGGKKFSES